MNFKNKLKLLTFQFINKTLSCNNQQTNDKTICSVELTMISFETAIHHQPYTPPRDKTNKVAMRPTKTQVSLGICPV